MLSRLSSISDSVNGPILFIAGTSVVMLVGITAVMIYFTIRYHRRRNPHPEDIHGHRMLEIVWTVIPTILAFGFFWYGWEGYKFIKTVPEGAMEVQVTGRMWSWVHEYENGVQSAELYVPVNKPVKLNLVSQDVLHSYYIPAFKVKQDAVPGIPDLFLWFEAYQTGVYQVFCAEYCGLSHSAMWSKVHVVTQDEFEEWLRVEGEKVVQIQQAAESGEGENLHILGEALSKSKGCNACHSIDGTRLIGPTYKGLYGKTETVVTGGQEREIVVDDAYIRNSMLKPTDDIVKGYQPLMPSQEGLVNESEIKALTAYIKSLQ
ncbi:MAG: cytochrome c oxidase subunit II [Candidatus Latescibacteria bacterium]|nr:cytochrome c oxidase subunit II [Candidatus Latescibacterota bacterium]